MRKRLKKKLYGNKNCIIIPNATINIFYSGFWRQCTTLTNFPDLSATFNFSDFWFLPDLPEGWLKVYNKEEL